MVTGSLLKNQDVLKNSKVFLEVYSLFVSIFGSNFFLNIMQSLIMQDFYQNLLAYLVRLL